MPARSIASSETLTHARRDSDDNTHDFLASGKKQGKGRKADGLNSRMSRMLQRANTSYTSDLPGPRTKRSRVSSARSSSSSALSSEIPKTPIDDVHRATQGSNLGSDFSIMKVGDASERTSPVFKLKDNLPSWRDQAEEKDESMKKPVHPELPGWLFHTFATLESGHPLKETVAPEPAPVYQSLNQPTIAIPHVSDDRSSARANEDVFAFAPPVADPHVDQEVPAAMSIDETAYTTLSNASNKEDHEEQSLAFEPPTTAQSISKVVHFLTPTKPSPVPAKASDFNPFSTPGPASRFSLFSPQSDLPFAKRRMPDDTDSFFPYVEESSDSTLNDADETTDSGKKRRTHCSNVSIEFNPGPTSPKPFSTPGPIFHGPPPIYFDAAFDEPLLDPSVDDLQLSPGVAGAETEIDESRVARFTARHHSEISNSNDFNYSRIEDSFDDGVSVDFQDMLGFINENMLLNTDPEPMAPNETIYQSSNNHLSYDVALEYEGAEETADVQTEPHSPSHMQSIQVANFTGNPTSREGTIPQTPRTTHASDSGLQINAHKVHSSQSVQHPCDPVRTFVRCGSNQPPSARKSAKFRPFFNAVSRTLVPKGFTDLKVVSLVSSSSDGLQEQQTKDGTDTDEDKNSIDNSWNENDVGEEHNPPPQTQLSNDSIEEWDI